LASISAIVPLSYLKYSRPSAAATAADPPPAPRTRSQTFLPVASSTATGNPLFWP
jgi:hypothetical protein